MWRSRPWEIPDPPYVGIVNKIRTSSTRHRCRDAERAAHLPTTAFTLPAKFADAREAQRV
jgi:hypothetical protein